MIDKTQTRYASTASAPSIAANDTATLPLITFAALPKPRFESEPESELELELVAAALDVVELELDLLLNCNVVEGACVTLLVLGLAELVLDVLVTWDDDWLLPELEEPDALL